MILIKQIRGDCGELLGNMLHMLQDRAAIHLFRAHFDHSGGYDGGHEVARMDQNITHQLLSDHSMGSPIDSNLHQNVADLIE